VLLGVPATNSGVVTAGEEFVAFGVGAEAPELVGPVVVGAVVGLHVRLGV
jgi:hypothetical protein